MKPRIRLLTLAGASLLLALAACEPQPAGPETGSPDDGPPIAFAKGGNGNGGGGPGGGDDPVLGTVAFGDAAGDAYRSDGGGSYDAELGPTRLVAGSSSILPGNEDRCVEVTIPGFVPGDCVSFGLVEKNKTGDVELSTMAPGDTGTISANSWWPHPGPNFNLKFGIGCPSRWGKAGPEDPTLPKIAVVAIDSDGDDITDRWQLSATVGRLCERDGNKGVIDHGNVPAAFSLTVSTG